MPTRNGGKPDRSKSRGRGRKKEPQLAVSDAHTASPDAEKDLSSLSPPGNSGLPLHNQNKNKTSPDTVSAPSSPTEATKAAHDKSLISTTISNEVIHERKTNSTSLDDKKSKGSHDAVIEVSDNTAHSLGTTPVPVSTLSDDMASPAPPPLWVDKRNTDQEDPFSSNPDDPWHFTFSELRAMRS